MGSAARPEDEIGNLVDRCLQVSLRMGLNVVQYAMIGFSAGRCTLWLSAMVLKDKRVDASHLNLCAFEGLQVGRSCGCLIH